jgi:hypothetical protein
MGMFLVVLLVFTVVMLIKSPRGQGWLGERITSLGVWAMLDASTYRRFDDVIVPSPTGTTQIDHVLVAVSGIFVIETKNMTGWIYGRAEEATWTQVRRRGATHRFQNPLRQNYRHIRALSDHLGLDPGLFHSVVWFIGDCTFKTERPPNVLTAGLIPYLREFTEPRLSQAQVEAAASALQALKEHPVATRREHVQSLAARHGSSTQCPRCGAPLRRRTARAGPRAGEAFLGCSRYPACRFTRTLSA